MSKIPKSKARDVISVELDWKSYYEDFKAIHGDPVEWKGQLLFEDGWRMEMAYGGREFPPPKDPGKASDLRAAFYRIIQAGLEAQADKLRDAIKRLGWLQGSKSQTLKQKIRTTGANGETVTESVPVDLALFEEQLGRVEQDLRECKERWRSFVVGSGG